MIFKKRNILYLALLASIVYLGGCAKNLLIGHPSILGQISFSPIFPWLDGFVDLGRLVFSQGTDWPDLPDEISSLLNTLSPSPDLSESLSVRWEWGVWFSFGLGLLSSWLSPQITLSLPTLSVHCGVTWTSSEISYTTVCFSSYQNACLSRGSLWLFCWFIS